MGLAGHVMVLSLRELRFDQRMSRTPLWVGLNWSGWFLGPGVSFRPGVMGHYSHTWLTHDGLVTLLCAGMSSF